MSQTAALFHLCIAPPPSLHTSRIDFFFSIFALRFCQGTGIDREYAKSVPLRNPVHFVHAYLLYYLSSAGAEEQVKVRDAGDGVYECEYYPLKPGKYTVSITWGGHPIPRRSVPVRSPQVSIKAAHSHSALPK